MENIELESEELWRETVSRWTSDVVKQQKKKTTIRSGE